MNAHIKTKTIRSKKKRKKSQHTVLLHDRQELHNDLRARSDKHLALARLLSIVDGIERIIEDTGLDHFDGSKKI